MLFNVIKSNAVQQKKRFAEGCNSTRVFFSRSIESVQLFLAKMQQSFTGNQYACSKRSIYLVGGESQIINTGCLHVNFAVGHQLGCIYQ
jgi:hypothetical protein